MKVIVGVLIGLMLAFAWSEQQNVSALVSSEWKGQRPAPYWAPPDTFINYAHWECPSGWTLKYGEHDDVGCITNAEDGEEMEKWLQTKHPVAMAVEGKPQEAAERAKL